MYTVVAFSKKKKSNSWSKGKEVTDFREVEEENTY
jgi:hypothetical protein